MTTEEMLSRVSSTELTKWIAFETVFGPIGPGRNDIQASIIAATVANANRAKGKPATPADFIPKWDRKATQTVEEMVEIAKALNAAFGGTVETVGGDDGTTE